MTKIVRFASSTMAVAATTVALGISYVAGTERGGLPVERGIWIGVGLVLALSAHLIPALLGRQSIARKAIGYTLWLACMMTTIGGHAQFFLQAQQHAGQARAEAVARPVAQGRNMIAILGDQANTEQRLAAKQAFLKSRYCKAGCGATTAEIAGLQGHLAVLTAEKTQAAKDASNQDKYEAKAEQAAMDPVAVALSQFGVAPEKVQTIMSMAAALTLELVACLFWSLSLSPLKAEARAEARQEQAVTVPVAAPVAAPAPIVCPAPVVGVANVPLWEHAVQIPFPSGAADETEEIVAMVAEKAEDITALSFSDRVKAMIRISRTEITERSLKRTGPFLARFGGAREAARLVKRALRANKADGISA